MVNINNYDNYPKVKKEHLLNPDGPRLHDFLQDSLFEPNNWNSNIIRAFSNEFGTCLHDFESKGKEVELYNSQGMLIGCPDLMFQYSNKIVYLEIKSGNSKTSFDRGFRQLKKINSWGLNSKYKVVSGLLIPKASTPKGLVRKINRGDMSEHHNLLKNLMLFTYTK